jgi:Zn-dependent peptidase ImmA (M78 family)
MNSSSGAKVKTGNYSKRLSLRKTPAFSSPLALGLCAAVPSAKDPVEAILWHAQMLILEAGLDGPPYPPALYAQLRKVKQIVQKNMEEEGRLLPCADGFIVELRKDRQHERKNFTCAHELGHTFFYEAVPKIKYRDLTSSQPHHDKEEEMLCNIAASELLMPSVKFSEIVRDFLPSPDSLQQVAQLFETSLIATTVRLLKLNLWNSTFILWRNRDQHLVAEWVAQPGRGLSYLPNLKVMNIESSSIYHTLQTGEATSRSEWLSLNDRFKFSHVQSKRLSNSDMVLSCSTQSGPGPNASSIDALDSALLPLNYRCECNGTRWRFIERGGRTYADRCRAIQHQIKS